LKIRLAIALFAIIFVAQGQTVRGVISGVVKDPSKVAVPSVSVTIINEESGAKVAIKTDAHGEFTVPGLLPGKYRVEAAADSFQKYAEVLTLEVNQEVRLDVQLQPPGRDSVDVTAETTLVRQESSALGGVIENRLITGLPLDGRNFYELSLLLPGVLLPRRDPPDRCAELSR
jgi:hypothetical protein